MLIDWFTVGAQAVNFLILVWLMKRFLYKPILNAIDAREKKVAAELADADAKRAEALKERDQFQQKNDEFDRQRLELMNKAQDDAKSEREKLLEEARQAAEQVRVKSKERFAIDAENLKQSISNRTKQEVFAIARKTLSDLASASLEEQVTATFIRRISEMDSSTRASLVASLTSGSSSATSSASSSSSATSSISGSASGSISSSPSSPTVRSAFELSPEQRAAIEAALNQALSLHLQLNFQTAPELISGIELVANGQSIAWNISDYLKAMEKAVHG
ncbi:MAG: F0F1 ATP synthase subunit B [Cyanobacteria bacterium PR.023]|nr:F0F1 ATP synthase subunit B [Cyanobacteria bacterium PR.023]